MVYKRRKGKETKCIVLYIGKKYDAKKNDPFERGIVCYETSGLPIITGEVDISYTESGNLCIRADISKLFDDRWNDRNEKAYQRQQNIGKEKV